MAHRARILARARWLAALLPVVPILVGLFLGAGSAGAGTSGTAPGALHPAPPASSPRPAGAPAMPGGSGTLVAVVGRTTGLHAAPRGRVLARIGRRSDFGGPQALWVRFVRGGWLGVVSPEAGNDRIGWIPASAATLSRVSWRIGVSLATRRLTVTENGQAVERYSVAIGKPSAPTPTGEFAVTDRLLTGDDSGPYGCCILALSAHAPHTIQGWSGGDRIAIHSTPETDTIGDPVSHGCVRLTLAEGRWLLAHIPLGTPVIISSA